jgi:arsenate reductase-like glutaredoxin family protein
MIPQVIGTKKSKDTRRIERYFKERRIDFQFVDVNQRAPKEGELDAIAGRAGGYDELIDPTSKSYQKRGMQYLDFDPKEELLEDPTLLRLPIVRSDRGAAVNPDTDELDALIPPS